MTFTHESGHILGGWCGGGKLVVADLIPWHLPYSIFDPDPHPLMTSWSGPILGAIAPVALACLLRYTWVWFIAYFCVLANGLYLATSALSTDCFLDTPKLIEHGASPFLIAIYCGATVGCGYPGFRRSLIRIWKSSPSSDAASNASPSSSS